MEKGTNTRMTEHILNFAISIDDDAIIKNVQQKADKQIINDIKEDLIRKIFSSRYAYCSSHDVVEKDKNGNLHVSRDADLSDAAERIIKEAIGEYKEDIIERAAKILAEQFKRTKAWKEKANEAIG